MSNISETPNTYTEEEVRDNQVYAWVANVTAASITSATSNLARTPTKGLQFLTTALEHHWIISPLVNSTLRENFIRKVESSFRRTLNTLLEKLDELDIVRGERNEANGTSAVLREKNERLEKQIVELELSAASQALSPLPDTEGQALELAQDAIRTQRTRLEEQEQSIKELRQETIRLEAEWKKSQVRNGIILKERDTLREQIQQLREEQQNEDNQEQELKQLLRDAQANESAALTQAAKTPPLEKENLRLKNELERALADKAFYEKQAQEQPRQRGPWLKPDPDTQSLDEWANGILEDAQQWLLDPNLFPFLWKERTGEELSEEAQKVWETRESLF